MKLKHFAGNPAQRNGRALAADLLEISAPRKPRSVFAPPATMQASQGCRELFRC
jgi:hypothetical protein